MLRRREKTVAFFLPLSPPCVAAEAHGGCEGGCHASCPNTCPHKNECELKEVEFLIDVMKKDLYNLLFKVFKCSLQIFIYIFLNSALSADYVLAF